MEHGHGGLNALECPRTQRFEFEVGRAHRLHAFADINRTGMGEPLQPGRNIGGVTDRRVVHAEVVADAPYHHRAGVQTHPQPDPAEQVGRARCTTVTGRFLKPLLDGQAAHQGAAHMVLVRQRRAEQGHETIAQELIDGAFDAMNFRHCQREQGIQDVVHLLGPRLPSQFGRIGHVAKQHSHLFALALDGGVAAEDLARQMRRGVRLRLALGRCRVGACHARGASQGVPAGIAEDIARRVGLATACAGNGEGGAAMPAKTGISAVLVITNGTVHGPPSA